MMSSSLIRADSDASTGAFEPNLSVDEAGDGDQQGDVDTSRDTAPGSPEAPQGNVCIYHDERTFLVLFRTF